jgi:protocatechuate 3,4-dioxygenase beta subunit
MRHLLIALLLLAPYLLAQEPANPPAQTGSSAPAPVTDKDKCTVEGKVVDAADGKPLRKAIVTLFPSERRDSRPMSVGTDADGIFTFKGVDPGRFRLAANRRGYVTQQYGQTATNRPGTMLTLQPGQHVKDILFRLQVSAAVSGRILDEDGEPLANVQVNALRHSYRDGRRTLMPAGFSSSNDLGEYRIFGLAPGEYFIRAAFSGNSMTGGFISFDIDQVGDSTYAPTFYPGVQEGSQATPINLRAADDIRVNFTLSPTRAFSIRGKVINPSASGGRASLTLMPRDEMEQFTFGPGNNSIVNPDGTFEFRHVLPGSYTIIGRTNDEKGRYTARQNIEMADRNLTNVIVAFSPASDIPGRFTVTGSFQGRLRDLNVFLQPDSGSRMGGETAGAKDDGFFVLTGVADDLYRIRVGGVPPNAYIKTARYGSEDVLEKGLDPAGAHQSLEIVVSGDGGRISGAVSDKDQKAQPGITVVAIPDHPIRWISERSKPTSTDQNGRFNIQGLRPGRYRLYAFEEIEPGAYDDPQFMKRYLDHGKAVDISENSQQTVDLTVIGREENQ